MKYFNSILVLILLSFSISVLGQVPESYYSTVEGKFGAELKTSLFHTIKAPKVISYAQLWEALEKTDFLQNNTVWDIYSHNPSGETKYTYDFRTNRCGNFSKEGDCYSREHILPRSWYKGTKLLKTDLFNVYPTDGYVNNRRSNLSYGEVGITLWESSNGSRVGKNTFGDYSKTVFEPIDEYKGDMARAYFYMVTAYEDDLPEWNSDQVGSNKYPGFSDWSLELMLKWHHEDPVCLKEVRRNEEIYKIQGNRNPFIDYPVLVEHIWGVYKEIPFQTQNLLSSYLEIECSPFERWLDQKRILNQIKTYFKIDK